MPEARRAWAAGLALALLAGATGAQAPAELAGEHLRGGEHGRALAAAARIEDPALRAEWRFAVLHAAGDLPAALAAAEQGLAGAPDHPRLLANATVCALALGLGQRALELSARLDAAADEPALRERARELAAQAQALAATEAAARAGARRARWVVGCASALGLAALVLLARPARRLAA